MTFAHGAQELAPQLLNLTGDGQGCNGTPGLTLTPCSASTEFPRLELVIHTRGKTYLVTAAPGRVAGAAVVDDRGIRAVVTVRREPAATGTDIVVSVALVDRIGRVEIPIEALVETVLPRNGIHVRRVIATQRIVVVLPARIARGRSCMRPTNTDVILRREVLGEGKPQAVSLPFVLELQIGRQVAFHVFVDSADRQAEIKRILHTGLERRFVRDVGQIGRRVSVAGSRHARKFRGDKIEGGEIEERRVHGLQGAVYRVIGADAVAVAVHPVVYFISTGCVNRPAFELVG